MGRRDHREAVSPLPRSRYQGAAIGKGRVRLAYFYINKSEVPSTARKLTPKRHKQTLTALIDQSQK